MEFRRRIGIAKNTFMKLGKILINGKILATADKENALKQKIKTNTVAKVGPRPVGQTLELCFHCFTSVQNTREYYNAYCSASEPNKESARQIFTFTLLLSLLAYNFSKILSFACTMREFALLHSDPAKAKITKFRENQSWSKLLS